MKIWHLDKECDQFVHSVISTREQRKVGVRNAVDVIKQEVLKKGDEALVAYGRQFDGWMEDHSLKVSKEELREAASLVGREEERALKGMIDNVARYHRSQRRAPRKYRRQGLTVLEEQVPVQKVLVYVPGGTAPYPSSLIMGAVPAKIAGVEEIYATTPTHDGRVNPYIAAAALLVDIKGLYRIGGAQAIYAFSYGIGGVPKVDLIVGPGNAYVEEAKRDVYGQVGIDMLAGPSELIVLLAGTFPAHIAAWDLFSQAEHDAMAMVGLFSPSKDEIYRLLKTIEREIGANKRREIVERALNASGFLVHYARLEDAVAVINLIAPEHLEVIGSDAAAERVKYAGITYAGPHTCVSMGDYYIGTNHILPTGGAGRFSSGLSLERFTKRKVLVKIEKSFLEKYGERATRLAEIEGLYAHGEAIKARKELE